MINNIAIVGAGALGMMYGNHLTHQFGSDHVSFVVDPDRYDRYNHSVFTCNGTPCNFSFISSAQNNLAADLVIFSVKATQLQQAMETASSVIDNHTVILSLLNGVTSEKLLEERFGYSNVVYCVAQGMDATRDGVSLQYTHMGQLRIGIPSGFPEKQSALDLLVDCLNRAEIPYVLEDDIEHRLWSKLMLNVGVNQVCMVTEGNYGTVQTPGTARDLMIAAMREVISVASREGIVLTEDDLNGYVALIDTLDPKGMPSMRQDGLAHRKSEVELFSGTIIRLGEKHHIAVPVNAQLYKTVLEMEARY